MASQFIKTTVEDGILRVLVDREDKRNALSLGVLGEIRETYTAHAADPDLLAAVITGAGNMAEAAFAALNAIRHFPVPVIAALNGDAIGGGAEFAVSCDMRVFGRHARIAFVQGNLCVSPAWGGGVDLMRLVGAGTALRLFARAEFIDGD